MAQSRTLTVVIAGDAKGAQKAFQEAEAATGGVEAKLARLSAGMKTWGDDAVRVGKSLALNVSLPVAALAAVAFRELQDSQKVSAQTEAAIRSTGGAANVTAGDVDRLATALMRKSGIDDEAIASGENLLLTFTNIRNEVGRGNDIFDRATKAALDLSVAFGMDMHSSSIMLGKALNDPVAGLTSLGRAGVQFTDSQKETIRSLVESGRVLDAQKIILGELETQVGGSARAYGETLPGQIGRAREALVNSSALILATAAPALERVAAGAEKVAGFLAGLPAPAQEAVAAFATVALAAGPVVLVAGKIAQGAAVVATGWAKMASFAETVAVKAMYAVDALKAMSAAQLVGLGVGGLLAGGLLTLTLLLATGRNRYDEVAEASKKWADVQFRNANAIGDEVAALQELQSTQSVLKAKVDEASEALQRFKDEGGRRTDPAQYTELKEELTRVQTRSEELTPKIEELKQRTHEARLAEEARTQALRGVATGTTDVATTSDDARNAIMQLQSQVLAASGGELGYQQSLINREKAQAELNKAIAEHGPLSQEAAAASLAAQQADIQAASAALGVDDAYTALKRTLYETPEAYDAEIRKLEEAKQKHPEVAATIQQQIDKLIWLKGELNSIPESKRTRVEAETETASRRLADYSAQINALPASVVTDIYAGIFGGRGYSEGGWVEGVGNGDTVPAMLTPGEFVVSKDMLAGRRPMPSSVPAGGGRTYQIVINVPPTADRAEIGRELVRCIDAYEQRGGR